MSEIECHNTSEAIDNNALQNSEAVKVFKQDFPGLLLKYG